MVKHMYLEKIDSPDYIVHDIEAAIGDNL